MKALARFRWIALLACLAIQVLAVEQNYEEAAERLRELMNAGRNEMQGGRDALREAERPGETTGPSSRVDPVAASADQGVGQDFRKMIEKNHTGEKPALEDWDTVRRDILPILETYVGEPAAQSMSEDKALLYCFHLIVVGESTDIKNGLGSEILNDAKHLFVRRYLPTKDLRLAFLEADRFINLAQWSRGFRVASAIRLFPLARDLLKPDTPWHLELLHKAALQATSLDEDTLRSVALPPKASDGKPYAELRLTRRHLHKLLTKDKEALKVRQRPRRKVLAERFAKAYQKLLGDEDERELLLSRGLIERLAQVPPKNFNIHSTIDMYVDDAIKNARLQELTGLTGPTKDLEDIATRKEGREPSAADHEAVPGSGPEAYPQHGGEDYGTDQAHQDVQYYGASTSAHHQAEPDNYWHAGQDYVEPAQRDLNRPMTPPWSSNDVYRPQMPTPPPSHGTMPGMPNSPRHAVYRPEMPTSPAALHGRAQSSRRTGGSNRVARQDAVPVVSEHTSRMGSSSRARSQRQSAQPMEISRGQTEAMADSLDAASRWAGRGGVAAAGEAGPVQSRRRLGAESGDPADASEMSVRMPRRPKAQRRTAEEMRRSRQRQMQTSGDASSDEAESHFSAAPVYGGYPGEGYGPAGYVPAYGPPGPWGPSPGATAYWSHPPPHYGGHPPDPSRYYPAPPEQPRDRVGPPPRSGYFSAQYGHPRPYPP